MFFREQCKGKNPDDHVFLMQSGRRWNGNHKALFREAVIQSGLPANFVFHGLRHTYASQLGQAGTPLAIVARQLGHANTDTVSRTYGHLSCISIERELSQRFASIEEAQCDKLEVVNLDIPDNRSDATYLETRTSWPLSNFSKASGELVASLRWR